MMRRVPVLLVAVLALSSCIKADKKSLTGTGGSTTTDFGMSATINGASWAAAAKPSVATSGSVTSIAGLNLTYGVAIAIVGLNAPGNYSLVFPGSSGSSGVVSNTTGGWDTYLQGGSGQVTFTTVTSSHLVGTFSFTAVAASGTATGTIQVTNGKFDITF